MKAGQRIMQEQWIKIIHQTMKITQGKPRLFGLT